MIIEFVKAQPLLSMALFSLVITAFLTFVYIKTTNQEKMKEVREKQKELQKKMKEMQGKPDKLLEIQKEMMQLSTEQMKGSMKSMIITFIPLIAVFYWLKNTYTAAAVGNIIYWKINLPLVGDGAGWFLSYIIFSLIFNAILRKILKVH